jgi:hypothetical protein
MILFAFEIADRNRRWLASHLVDNGRWLGAKAGICRIDEPAVFRLSGANDVDGNGVWRLRARGWTGPQGIACRRAGEDQSERGQRRR